MTGADSVAPTGDDDDSVEALALAVPTATLIKELLRASWTGTPTPCELGREQGFAVLSRPVGGDGPICMAGVVAGDGRWLVEPLDLRQYPARRVGGGEPFGVGDCFGVAAFVSKADPSQGGGTVKFVVNARLDGDNGRAIVIVSTGIVPDVTR